MKVELRDNREIVITKGEAKAAKTPTRDPARRQNTRTGQPSSEKRLEYKPPTKSSRVAQKPTNFTENDPSEEYIKTKEYEDEDGEFHVKTSPLRESARERSSSNNQRRRPSAGADRANYKNHPRRIAFKK